MTDKEHQLMVHMFAQQTTLIRSLLEILEAREVLTIDDFAAYHSLVRSKEENHQRIFHSVVQDYTDTAQSLGLQDDLPAVDTAQVPKA